MKVKLTRRWGPHSAPKTVEVSDSQGRWLIQHNYAESSGEVQAPEQRAAAEGAHGADPLAGGDATRRRPRITKPERDADRNYARRAAGSSPTYRGGYDAEAAKREGEAGRVAARAAESSDEPSSTSAGADSGDEDSTAKRPARRRSKSPES